jgi:two-component system, sensor histidine kinase and response regulator
MPSIITKAGGANILIVDDNTFNVYSLRLLIEETFKMPCDIAYSGKEALLVIKQRLEVGLGVHKVILTDINMPEIDGLQLARIIKRNLL